MAMQHLENELRRTGNPADLERANIVSAMLKARGADVFLSAVGTATPIEARTAVQIPESAFEIPTVSEALYKQTREALAKEGYTFVIAINPESIGQLVASETTIQRFDYVNPSEEMRSNIPPQIEVAIDPNHFRIEGSNNKSTDVQIAMIRKWETAFKSKFPKEVGDIISMIMPKHASILAQLDFKHQEQTEKVLFTNWFGRTDDQTVPGSVADVGRFVSTSRLIVDDWFRDVGYHRVFALPVVVLPRKLAV